MPGTAARLDASEEQLDSPIIFCSGRTGQAGLSPDQLGEDLTVLFEKILDQIPAPEGDAEGPTQLLVSSIDYNEYVAVLPSAVWSAAP